MNNQDPSLQSPLDANTGKQVNFRETEEAGTSGNQNSGTEDETPVQRQWREMREEESMKRAIDPSLETPQDANTQKHIDFLRTGKDAANNDESTPRDDEETLVQRQWREMREQKANDTIDPSLSSPQDANTQKHIDFLDTD